MVRMWSLGHFLRPEEHFGDRLWLNLRYVVLLTRRRRVPMRAAIRLSAGVLVLAVAVAPAFARRPRPPPAWGGFLFAAGASLLREARPTGPARSTAPAGKSRFGGGGSRPA